MKQLDHFIKQYKGSDKPIAMPMHDMDPERKKDMAYFVKCAEYLFHLGANQRLYAPNVISGKSKYAELRRYSRNNIDISKYKNRLLGKDRNGKDREKSFMNISWRPDKGFEKTRDQMRGAYEKMDYDIEVKAVDPASGWMRDLEIAGLKIYTNQEFKSTLKEVGVEMGSDAPFENEVDVDIYVKSGGLKLQTEIAMKKALDCSISESAWRNLKIMLFDDMIDLGIAATKDYIDTLTGVPVIRYVDPDRLLIPCSKYLDFRDITHAGELVEMTIAEVRAQSDLDENQLQEIAIKWGYNRPGGDINMQFRSHYEESGSMPYDHIKVWVLDCCWLSSDISKFTEKYLEKYQVTQFKKRDHSYDLKNKEANRGKKLHEKRTQFCYQCKWIIGTDFAFSYGKEYYQLREGQPGFKRSLLPYHITTTGSSSKMERMIADIDEINILTYKRRNAIACIPAPPGIIFNKSALEYTDLDGNIKTPAELMNQLLEKGVLGVETEDENGVPVANIGALFGNLSSNLFEQFRIFSEQIAEKRLNIQLTTGINDVVDGTSSNERRLQVEGEAKIEAANNAMQIEYAELRELMQNTLKNVMMRWQEVVRFRDFKKEFMPIDRESIEVIELTKDLASVTFGINVSIGSTYQQRTQLLQELIMLKDARRQGGTGGITQDSYLSIHRVIMGGNIPLAQLLLTKAIKDQERADEERAQRNIQAQSQAQADAGTQIEVEKRKSLLAEKTAEIILESSKSNNKIAELIVAKALELGQEVFNAQEIRSSVEGILSAPESQVDVLVRSLSQEDQRALSQSNS